MPECTHINSPTCTVYVYIYWYVYIVYIRCVHLCTLYSVQCTIYSVQCTMYSLQCTPMYTTYTVYTLHIAICTMCTLYTQCIHAYQYVHMYTHTFVHINPCHQMYTYTVYIRLLICNSYY